MTCTTVYHCRHARFMHFITPMKKIFFILLISSQTVLAQFVDANLKASGLTCSMCNLATQRQLQQLTFIDSIVPDLDLNLFHIYFNQQQEVDIDLIKKSVEDAAPAALELVTVPLSKLPIKPPTLLVLADSNASPAATTELA